MLRIQMRVDVEGAAKSGWIGRCQIVVPASLDVLRQPPDPLAITYRSKQSVVCFVLENLPQVFVEKRMPNSPCLITTLHMNTSIGLIPSSGTFPFPVV